MNKGEKSEFYALISLASSFMVNTVKYDDNTNAFRKIGVAEIQAIRYSDYLYQKINGASRDENETLVRVTPDYPSAYVASHEELSNLASAVLSSIRNEYSVPFSLFIPDKTAPSSDKADLFLLIDGISGCFNQEFLGFSVKSFLGQTPTLFNASKSSAICFDISNCSEITKQNMREYSFSYAFKTSNIDDSDISYHLSSPVFRKILQMSDSNMPNILSRLVFDRIRHDYKSTTPISQIVAENDYSEHEIAALKRLFVDMFYGMTATHYRNMANNNGGFIFIMPDASIVMMPFVFSGDNLSEFIFHSVGIDFPSRHRHDYGYVYADGDKEMIDINFQIRFISSVIKSING